MDAVFSSSEARRPASATEYPADCNFKATARPMPLPAPVTNAILCTKSVSHGCARNGNLDRMQLTTHDRILGGLWGLLVGDAAGVPYEFHHPRDLPVRDGIEMVPPAGFARAHPSVAPGTWSDDGAQALALLASLLACGRFDACDFGRRLVDWFERGYLTADGRVFDCGIQTAQAIRAIAAGTPPQTAGRCDEMANGNGSLMRALPLALWHRGTDTELAADAHAQSAVTHGHIRSQDCCAVYCLWARRILDEVSDPWDGAISAALSVYGRSSIEWRELESHIRPHEPPVGAGTGYVVDCLQSARMVLAAESRYEDVVKASIALGHDTDTTACVAAGLAGLREGLSAIPTRWLDLLVGVGHVVPLVQPLLSRQSGT
jgi:ADP-ribosyl-[dinitrogen reductase] hydrolase